MTAYAGLGSRLSATAPSVAGRVRHRFAVDGVEATPAAVVQAVRSEPGSRGAR